MGIDASGSWFLTICLALRSIGLLPSHHSMTMIHKWGRLRLLFWRLLGLGGWLLLYFQCLIGFALAVPYFPWIPPFLWQLSTNQNLISWLRTVIWLNSSFLLLGVGVDISRQSAHFGQILHQLLVKIDQFCLKILSDLQVLNKWVHLWPQKWRCWQLEGRIESHCLHTIFWEVRTI